MQDYWIHEMEWVWQADEDLTESQRDLHYGETIFDPPLDEKIATKQCGLTWTFLGKPDKITKDTCYPLVVRGLQTFAEFENKNYKELIEDRGGFVYKPGIDPPLYKAEFYNKDVEFSVIDRRPRTGYLMPRDCCKLMSYEKVTALEKNIDEGDSWEAVIFTGWNWRLLPLTSLEKHFFLVTKYWDFQAQSKFGYREVYSYQPITHCGKLITY